MINRTERGCLPGRYLRAICACAAVMAIGLGACAQETDIPELLEPVGVVTDTAQAYIGDISNIAIYEAAVTPYVEGVAFTVSGIVDEVQVVVGQSVRKGDVLITLDQESQIERRETLGRRIDELQVGGNYEDRLYEIDRSILELELEMLMSRSPDDVQAIDLKKLDMEAFELEAELAREMRGLELARLREELASVDEQMGENVLTAPFDGTVMYIGDIACGSYVNAFTKLVFIADDSKMRIETEYITDKTLQQADRLYALVGSGEYDLNYIPVDQKELFSKVNAGETITTVFEIIEPDGQIEMGAYAVVCREYSMAENVLLIPRNALYMEAGSRHVYVMKDGVRERRDVETGCIAEHAVEIKSGLEEGDVVYVQE